MPENGAGPVREKPLIHREALMRTLIWFLASIFLFGITTSFPSHSMERKKEGILYPEGDIQEIRIYGNYEPHDPQRLDNFKEMLIRNHYLKPGDVLKKSMRTFWIKETKNSANTSDSIIATTRLLTAGKSLLSTRI